MSRFVLRAAFACATAFLLSATAQAQLFRAYVASTGSDTNPCTLQAPCRLLPAALNAVAAGGEIWMLDSANFNTSTVNISKSVAILSVPGAVGSIVATGGTPAVSISTADISVALRNVVIVNIVTNPGSFGVFISGGPTVSIEDSLIAIMPNNAIVAQAGSSVVYVKGTLIRDNSGYAVMAINGATVNIMASRMIGNNNGIEAFTSLSGVATEVNVTDSTIAGAISNGVLTDSTNSTGSARITLTRTTIADASTGINAISTSQGLSLVTVTNSTVTGCKTGGISISGGVIESLGNNYIGENGPDVGSLTPLGLR